MGFGGGKGTVGGNWKTGDSKSDSSNQVMSGSLNSEFASTLSIDGIPDSFCCIEFSSKQQTSLIGTLEGTHFQRERPQISGPDQSAVQHL